MVGQTWAWPSPWRARQDRRSAWYFLSLVLLALVVVMSSLGYIVSRLEEAAQNYETQFHKLIKMLQDQVRSDIPSYVSPPHRWRHRGKRRATLLGIYRSIWIWTFLDHLGESTRSKLPTRLLWIVKMSFPRSPGGLTQTQQREPFGRKILTRRPDRPRGKPSLQARAVQWLRILRMVRTVTVIVMQRVVVQANRSVKKRRPFEIEWISGG
jgi:hypothetical protein